MMFVVAGTVLVCARAAWILDYFRRHVAGGAEPSRWRRLRAGLAAGWSMSSAQAQEAEPSRATHAAMVQVSERQRDTAFVGGSLALAAWTQLFVSSASGPAERIAPASLALLFAGGFVLVTLPVLFRSEGSHLTYVGRESALNLGFGTVVVALCSMLADLAGTVGLVAASVVAVTVVVREVIEVVDHLRMHRLMQFGRTVPRARSARE